MLTEESYQLYLNAQKELVRRKEEADRLAREQEMLENDPVRKQLKMTVEEGNEYIRRIREINDDIPGEEISNKLYRLERVCTKIFEYIEDNPEKLSDIRKFMNYYLPTTLKLVQTYHEFSGQPVQGENITKAKKEIEEMLELLPLLHHLPPPTALVSFQLQRNSPVFRNPRRYGLDDVRPHPWHT